MKNRRTFFKTMATMVAGIVVAPTVVFAVTEKLARQQALLDDSIAVYRLVRLPERRVYKVDVGSMSPERAKQHLEMIKNEIHQRRIPSRTLA